MVTKRLEAGRYQWPRSKNEAINLTQEQFDWLMKGLSIVPSIREINRKLTI
jgi:transposase